MPDQTQQGLTKPPSGRFLDAYHARWTTPAPYGEIAIHHEGELIGHVDLQDAGPDIIWVSSICLFDEQNRRKGHGSRLVQELVDLAREHGCEIALQAFHNPARENGGWLPAFYEKLGFERYGEPDEEGYQEMVWRPKPEPEPVPAL